MPDLMTLVSDLRRPRLLVRAARAGSRTTAGRATFAG